MKTVHFIETNSNTVLVTTDKSKAPKDGYLPYPLRYRSFISDIFQWSMIKAYLDEKWTVVMDDDVKMLWDSRPDHFRKA